MTAGEYGNLLRRHMGLDMYAFKVKLEKVFDDFHYSQEEPISELYYWRGHQDLHHWMHDLYKKKGGVRKQFNQIPLRLTLEDLNKLEQDIPELHNAFDYVEEKDFIAEKNYDLKFIQEAKEAIANGFAVYYDSSW